MSDLRDTLRGLRVFDDELPEFDTSAVPEDPADLFEAWLGDAIERGVRAPHAMTLATIDSYGRPDSRVLLLKDVPGGRFEFATSGASRKARQIEDTHVAAATFHWPEIARQVRVRGRVADGDREAAARDFLARPEESRAESFHGRQSRPLDDRAELDAAFEEGLSRVKAEPELVPDHWSVYQLVPDEVEFWQGRADRRHVRLRYRHASGAWTHTLVWP